MTRVIQKRVTTDQPFERKKFRALECIIRDSGESSMEIGFAASEGASAAIDRIGRTEDVQFSPSGRLLAVAGFNENRLLILETEANWGSELAVALKDPLQITSDSLQRPHGLYWIDERTIIVANRTGQLVIFELPEEPESSRIRLSPVRIFGDETTDLVKTPGSVSVASVGLDLIEVLVCNNYVHHVSRLLLDRRNNYALVASEILTQEGVVVPDGVASSPSGDWIAISNHGHHNVFLYRNDSELGRDSRPQAVLTGVNYPHGVRFADNGKTVLVADAGAPFVHLYRSDGDWVGEIAPERSIRVMSDETYQRGRINPAEGGPKGLDITRDGKMMVVSCDEVPFAFFDVRSVLDQRETVRPSNLTEAESARETLLRYMALDRLKVDQETVAIRSAIELEMGIMLRSRSWRLTAPLRKATAAIRKAAPGWAAKHEL